MVAEVGIFGVLAINEELQKDTSTVHNWQENAQHEDSMKLDLLEGGIAVAGTSIIYGMARGRVRRAEKAADTRPATAQYGGAAPQDPNAAPAQASAQQVHQLPANTPPLPPQAPNTAPTTPTPQGYYNQAPVPPAQNPYMQQPQGFGTAQPGPYNAAPSPYAPQQYPQQGFGPAPNMNQGPQQTS
jgi:hypothetical protein